MNQWQTMIIAANVVTKWPLIALTTCAAVAVMIQPALLMGRVTQVLAMMSVTQTHAKEVQIGLVKVCVVIIVINA